MSYCSDKRGWCGRKADCRDHFCEGHPLNATRRVHLAQFPDDPAPRKPVRLLLRVYVLAALAVLAIVQPDFSPLLQWVGEFFQKGQP